jgi:hypothetical protein
MNIRHRRLTHARRLHLQHAAIVKKRRISAITAARFNRLGMDALGCQVAVSLMVLSPISNKGTKSTRNRRVKQICANT